MSTPTVKPPGPMCLGELVVALRATHVAEVGGQKTEVMTLQLPAGQSRERLIYLLEANDGMGLGDILCSQRKTAGYFFAVVEFDSGVWAFWESHAAFFNSVEEMLATDDKTAALNSHEKTLLRMRAHAHV